MGSRVILFEDQPIWSPGAEEIDACEREGAKRTAETPQASTSKDERQNRRR